MLIFITRRLVTLLVTLLAGFTLLFLLFFLLPGNPAEVIASGNGRAPRPERVREIERLYGLDKPIYEQYWNRLTEVVTLSGSSLQTKEPVRDMVVERLPNSIRLALWAMAIEATFGILGGVLSARRPNSLLDGLTTTSAILLGAIPVFVLAYLIKQVSVVSFQNGWPSWTRLPSQGLGPDEWFLGIIPSPGQLRYLVQPAVVLASVSAAVVARLTRTSMLEAASSEHVRTARAKGLPERKVLTRHTLRNALIPIVTFIGVDFGTLVGFAVLTETVFNWPGIGSKVARAASQSDLPVVLALSVVVMAVYGLTTLAVDVSYAVLDPRIRVGKQR